MGVVLKYHLKRPPACVVSSELAHIVLQVNSQR